MRCCMKNRIRELRKSRGMTMKQLGAVVELAESTISQYETGKRQPDNETLLRLGEFFGVPVDYILGNDMPKSEEQMDSFTFAMHNASRDLSEQDKQLLVDMAERLRKMNKKQE